MSVVLTAHREGPLAEGGVKSVLRAAEVAARAGVAVEVIVVLDRPDARTAAFFTGAAPEDWRKLTVDYGDTGSSRNEGARQALGRWVAYLDADDLFDPNWLAAAHEAAEGDPRLVVWHPELNVFFGGDVRVWPHVDMDDPAFDPVDLVHSNDWTALCFAPRRLLLEQPYRPIDLSCQLGYEDWAWNRDVIVHGAIHKVVAGTGHIIRVKEQGSMLRTSETRRCIPHPTELFRRLLRGASHAPSLRDDG